MVFVLLIQREFAVTVCYSNFVPKKCHLSDIRLQKCRDFEIWVRGHLRSLKMVPFDRLCMVSYYCPIVTLSVRDIWLQKYCDLENRVKDPWRSLKMSPFNRDPITSYWCSVGSISCRFWDIQCRKISRPWNPNQEPIKVIESGTIL